MGFPPLGTISALSFKLLHLPATGVGGNTVFLIYIDNQKISNDFLMTISDDAAALLYL